MFIRGNLFYVPLAFLFLVFTSPTLALEKDKFVLFIKEYNASQNKYSGKIAYAIENNQPDIAEFLLLRGESVGQYSETYPLDDNHPDKNKNYSNIHMKHSLLTAIKKGYTEIAILMIQQGNQNAEEYRLECDIAPYSGSRREVKRKNAMFIAIEHNNDDVARALLSAGFDANARSTLVPTTPLLFAIQHKNLKIAELLLRNGADVEMISKIPGLPPIFEDSPLMKAVEDNFVEGVHLLLQYGADPLEHYNNDSPMDRAIQKGCFDIVDLLFNAM